MGGVFVAMAAFGMAGCNDSNDRTGNLLTDPNPSTGKADRSLLDDPVPVDDPAPVEEESVDFLNEDDPTASAELAAAIFHVDTGPDATSYVSGSHITVGADRSKYRVRVHIPRGIYATRYTTIIISHITSGPNRSRYQGTIPINTLPSTGTVDGN